MLAYMRLDFLAWLFMSVVLGRIGLILRHPAAASPFWDGLAFGGVLYVLAYYCLGISNTWYLAPADPHRSAVCRSACGSVVEKDGLMVL